MQNQSNNKPVYIIPSSAETIIIVLGQCTLQSGEPHPWLIDRVNTAYELLTKEKLDVSTTYLIVSGSDVSNRQYGIFDQKLKHPSEAYFMHKLLTELYDRHEQKEVKKIDKFTDHVIIEDKANTTIENFYYAFKILHNSNVLHKIKNIYVLTSDFHMNRTKFVFRTFMFNGSDVEEKVKRKDCQQLIPQSEHFDYEKNVHYISSPSKWDNQAQRDKKFEKQAKLLRYDYLISEAHKTARRLWSEFGLIKQK